MPIRAVLSKSSSPDFATTTSGNDDSNRGDYREPSANLQPMPRERAHSTRKRGDPRIASDRPYDPCNIRPSAFGPIMPSRVLVFGIAIFWLATTAWFVTRDLLPHWSAGHARPIALTCPTKPFASSSSGGSSVMAF